MDIYGAEAHVKKLLAYVESLADTRPRMYGKSKERLKGLALTCSQVIFTISEILQEEVLCDDVSEFGESGSEVIAVLDSMEEQLSRLREFTAYEGDQHPAPQSKINAADRKKIMQLYRSALRKLHESQTGFEYVDECAQILYEWFEVRFFRTASNANFRYNIRRIPGWIRDFVILYSYSVVDGHREDFCNHFQQWLEEIRESGDHSNYAVPYEVYQFNKNPDPEKISLEAAVIWDIMLANGLDEACNDLDDLMLSEDSVYSFCCDLNPDKMDDYADYQENIRVLKKVDLGRRKEISDGNQV